jgi:hypothetical protein
VERQNRLLTVLVTVLLVLVAIALFGKKPDDDAGADPDAPPEHKLFTFDAATAQTLALTNGATTISFEKAEGTWKMTAPKQIAVEERRVTEILDRIASLKVQDKGFDGPLADFGLDEAGRATVDIGTGDGKHLVLYVGRDAPVGYGSYAAEKPEGPALLASSRVGDLVKRGPDDFRSKEPWKIATGSAHRVRIEDAGTTVVLRKDDHGWWLGDDGPRAASDKVDDWLSRAGMLRAESFEDGADPATLGLATPSAAITVDDDAGTHELKFGNRDEKGIEAQSDAGLIRLGTDAVDLLKPTAWTETKLLPVRHAQVDTVDVLLGDKTGRFLRADDAWQDAAGAASTAPDAILTAIEAATADRASAPVALTETWGHVTLAEGTSRTETVTLGQVLPDGSRAAKDEAGGPTFRVPAAALTAIAAALP